MARVLIIVQGDHELGECVGEVLALLGHQTLVATSGAHGWHLLDSVAPDLVITDVALPGIDRLEAFHRLYDRPGPKIIEIRDSCRAWDSTEWPASAKTLHKPFTEAELVAAVEMAISGR
jgi:DNA-binding response OmpR family regulator